MVAQAGVEQLVRPQRGLRRGLVAGQLEEQLERLVPARVDCRRRSRRPGAAAARARRGAGCRRRPDPAGAARRDPGTARRWRPARPAAARRPAPWRSARRSGSCRRGSYSARLPGRYGPLAQGGRQPRPRRRARQHRDRRQHRAAARHASHAFVHRFRACRCFGWNRTFSTTCPVSHSLRPTRLRRAAPCLSGQCAPSGRMRSRPRGGERCRTWRSSSRPSATI